VTPAVLRLAVLALGTAFGLQALRAFFPLLLYVLRDRVGFSSAALGGFGLALFATGLAWPVLVRRRAGPPGAFAALLAARVAMQLWSGDPGVSLGLAAAAVLAFMAFLAAPARERGVGFLLGALLDVSTHAAFGTRDLHWGGIPQTVTLVVLAGAGAAGAWALRGLRDEDAPAPGAAALFAWGPFLLLHLEVLANVARHSARTGLPTARAGELVAFGFAAAVIAGPRVGRALRGRFATLVLAALVLPILLVPAPSLPIAVLALFAAQVAAAVLLLRALEPGESAPSAAVAGGACAGGWVALLILLFAHYAGYDLPLPIGRAAAQAIGAMLLLAAALGAARRDGGASPATRVTPLPVPLLVAALLLTVLPIVRSGREAAPPEIDPDATVVVTFNLHAGFDERGGWALERMLDSAKAARPDVLALQEVSRGWVVNGSADLYELARERLGLHGAPGPTVGSDWGSAVFTREPIVSARTVALPSGGLALTRAVTIVARDVREGTPARLVVATHLHHRGDDHALREAQARALVAVAPGIPDGVLLGDFNALPESGTFRILREAGWQDAAGPPSRSGLAPTYPSREPARRIDAILAGDLARWLGCEVAPAWGSDHRAVILRLRRG
jgi:endonuclease/exonuclease/phosphatase family metal-dependent hydrolase